MEKTIKRILFVSDLSEEARHAFDFALNIACFQGARLLILHVMENLPPGSEERVAASFGQELYKVLKSRKAGTAHDILIGKKVESVRVRDATTKMCKELGVSSVGGTPVVEDILITEGDVAEEALSMASKNACDLIAIGARRRRLFPEFASNTIRKLLQHASIPVLIVPPKPTAPKR